MMQQSTKCSRIAGAIGGVQMVHLHPRMTMLLIPGGSSLRPVHHAEP